MGKSRGFIMVVILTLSFLLPGLAVAGIALWRPASWSDLAAAGPPPGPVLERFGGRFPVRNDTLRA